MFFWLVIYVKDDAASVSVRLVEGGVASIPVLPSDGDRYGLICNQRMGSGRGLFAHSSSLNLLLF